MAIGMKDKIAALVAEESLEKRQELGRELMLLCEEIRKLVEDSHEIVARLRKLESGFID